MQKAERFRIQAAQPGHPALQIALPLVSDHDGELRCIGTGFAVAPGLAITAAHVVDEWLDYQQQRDGYKKLDSVFQVAALQLFEGKICEWLVDEMYVSRVADIAFLRFRRPNWWGEGEGKLSPRCARLSFNPPSVGEEVRVFGFPKSEVKGGVLIVTPAECVARVKQVDLKNDIRIRPASYLHLEGEIEGGMSGGPCFDKDGNVIAVNSRGWSFTDGDPLSYAALLWPAMNTEIDPFRTGRFPAFDLFKQGPLRALGYSRVYVTSTRDVHLAKTTTDDLVALPVFADEGALELAVNFSGANAQQALGEVRLVIEEASSSGSALRINDLHRALRHYFWELDSAVRIAIRLKAVRLGIDQEKSAEWGTFTAAWQDRKPSAKVLDKLMLLGFSWQSTDLFEMRTYAEWCRSGYLTLTAATSVSSGQTRAVVLEPCHRHGHQVGLPDDLNRFIDSSKKFVQRLLLLDHGQT